MLTEPMLRSIHALLPADDARSYALRRLVRTLARNGGEMSWAEAVETLGADSAPLVEARTWDGVRLSGCGLGATLALAPYVRRAVGLDVSANELLSDLGRDETARRARLNGYDSDPCPRCHERRTVSSGNLHACEGCGHRWTEAPAPDPLADVRRAVAGATNVEYALVAGHVCSLGPREPATLPRAVAGVAL